MCSLHAISTPVCTGSDTPANLAVLQTGTVDPKSRDVKFRRRRPDMQSYTLLDAYILLLASIVCARACTKINSIRKGGLQLCSKSFPHEKFLLDSTPLS